METYLANVKAQTGKTPDDFRTLAQEKGLVKHSEIVAWLKSEFGLGHGHANAVTHVILHADEPAVSVDDSVAAHFTGAKSAWRPAYNTLMETVRGFGPDVSASPGKTYINLLRGNKKFGIVQVTGKRLDLGIKRSGTPAEGRFEEAGSWNPMVTHRVRVEDPAQIDAEVIDWLRHAYASA